jgi:hypothetical protein
LFFIFWNVKQFLFTLTLQFPHQHNSDDNVENSLFLAANEPHRPVRTQTISSWIVNTIKCAYNEKDKFRAHSTRACTFKTAVNFLFFIFWNVKQFLFTLTLQFPHQHDKDKIG